MGISKFGLSLIAGMFFLHASPVVAKDKEANTLPRIDVEPLFRTTPIWYWKNSEAACVPVPSYDVIQRAGPQKMREAGISSDKTKSCTLTLRDRKLIAVLLCEGKIIENFYSREKLCLDSAEPVVKSSQE